MLARHIVQHLALAVSFACVGTAAHAAVIDVQFAGRFSFNCPGGGSSCTNPQQTGAAYVGAAGDQWNYFHAASGSAALVDATGAASGVSIQFSSNATYSSYTDGTLTNNFYGTPYGNLFGGYLATNTQNGITVTLSGLAANQSFALYTYSEQDGRGSSGRSMAVKVNGTTQNDTQSGAGSFIAGDTYLKFSGVADASGNVNIAVSTLSGESDLNGLQLVTATAVPEPASAALVLAGLGLAGIARQRRRSA